MEDITLTDASDPSAINITEDGGVTKTVITPGTGHARPAAGDQVSVHYVGTLQDGTQFDSSRDRDEEFCFELGASSVIQGWDLSIPTMLKGEVARVVIQSECGYGAAGSPPTIPPAATLTFEIELLSWVSAADISGDGGVLKTITKAVHSDSLPGDLDELLVSYECRLVEEGAEEGGGAERPPPFLTSPEGGLTITLEHPHLCDGLREGLKTMKEGECADFTLQPQYAFGEAGREGCPPNSVVCLSVDLLRICEVVDVNSDGGVIKKRLQPGEDPNEYMTPNEGSKVRVSYSLQLADSGEMLREAGEEVAFTVDEEEVPVGLEKAVMRMRRGETAEVTVQPAFGYGLEDVQLEGGATVPGGSTLRYVVTLRGFENAKQPFEFAPSEKVAAAEALKDKGNRFFKKGSYQHAAEVYQRGVQMVATENPAHSAEEARGQSDLKKSLHLNAAMCHLKLAQPRKAIAQCNHVLQKDPTVVKALYRRASAYMDSQDYLEAKQDLQSAAAYDPDNREVAQLLRKLAVVSKAADKRDKAVFGGMFKNIGSIYKDVPDVAPTGRSDVEMAEVASMSEGGTEGGTEGGPAPATESDVEMDAAAANEG